jgi:hypothetical protein
MDEIDETVLEYQDKVAEVVMGLTGKKFQVGQLKALVGDSSSCSAFLNDLEKDVLKYKESIGNEAKVAAIHNIIDDFLSDIYKWKYRETQK